MVLKFKSANTVTESQGHFPAATALESIGQHSSHAFQAATALHLSPFQHFSRDLRKFHCPISPSLLVSPIMYLLAFFHCFHCSCTTDFKIYIPLCSCLLDTSIWMTQNSLCSKRAKLSSSVILYVHCWPLNNMSFKLYGSTYIQMLVDKHFKCIFLRAFLTFSFL